MASGVFEAEPFLKQLTTRPGVYQMYDRSGGLLYVGKAKNLKNRVTSYFRASGLSAKTMALVARIQDIQVTVTTTERDALLLEHNLIKEYHPPYNILLKDDKSYPYIYLSSEDKWPKLGFHRGPKRRKGEYFGPYPSAGAVRSTLHLMQKVFKVRQCEESYFRNRSRPCLQYQIGRCSGPCVGLVSDEDYQKQVENSALFLSGKSQKVMKRLADDMERAAEKLEFEKAAAVGMNTMRVFLHDLAWKQDPQGFFKRVDRFLDISEKHDIHIMFVIFDGVWNPYPRAGKQPAPVPHVHNSGWVQSPGRAILEDPNKQDELKQYVQAVISRYKDDDRVLIWDLFNEPDMATVGNFGEDTDVPEMPAERKKATSLALLKKTFVWVREIGPSQPLTVGVWGDPTWIDQPDDIETFSLTNSDVISFHSYSGPEETEKMLAGLKKYNRPIMCTEYMARSNNSTFEGILPVFHKSKVAAYHWGLFSGKSQTIYPWSSWEKTFTAEPKLWHHDVFRNDGTPFDSKETELIKKLTTN